MIMNEPKSELSQSIFCIDKYDGKKPARIPDALYDLHNVRFEIKNIRYFRLLITISQNVILQDNNPNLFQYNDYAIKRKDLIKYLGMTTTKRNYSLIKELEYEINTNMPHFKITKRGPRGESFMNIYWFDYFGYNAETDYVMYKLTDSAKPFITSLKRYNKVTPYIANQLSNEVQAWLYPWLKSDVNLETLLEVDLAELKSQLVKETDKIYDELKYKNATTRFFNKILGIRKATKGQIFTRFGYIYVEMDVIADNQISSKSINYINELTDITVKVWAKRKDRKYVGLAFDVSLKPDFKEIEDASEIARMKKQVIKRTKKYTEIDCVKRNHERINEETKMLNNLFSQMPPELKPKDILQVTPADREEISFEEMKQKWINFVNANGIKCAQELNTIGRFASHMGYKLDESKMIYYK